MARYVRNVTGTTIQITDTQYPNGTGSVSQVVTSWDTGVTPTADELAAADSMTTQLNGG